MDIFCFSLKEETSIVHPWSLIVHIVICQRAAVYPWQLSVTPGHMFFLYHDTYTRTHIMYQSRTLLTTAKAVCIYSDIICYTKSVTIYKTKKKSYLVSSQIFSVKQNRIILGLGVSHFPFHLHSYSLHLAEVNCQHSPTIRRIHTEYSKNLIWSRYSFLAVWQASVLLQKDQQAN